MKGELRCPLCQARFRAVAESSRCSADLASLVLLAAHAYVHRQAARQMLRQGNHQAALASIEAAQELHATVEGRRINLVCGAAAGMLTADSQVLDNHFLHL